MNSNVVQSLELIAGNLFLHVFASDEVGNHLLSYGIAYLKTE